MALRAKGLAAGRGMVGYGAYRAETKLPAPPTQARGVEKRDRLYLAAVERFREAGIADTRIEDVIADAGVSWATFFRYFPRKEDVLIEAAARHFRQRVLPLAERAIIDRRIKVRRATERVFTTMLEPAELTAPLHNQALLEVFSYPARFAAMLGDGSPAPFVDLMYRLLVAGQERGEVDSGLEAGAAALTVAAGALFPAVQATAAGADPGHSIRMALEVLWRGLDPR